MRICPQKKKENSLFFPSFGFSPAFFPSFCSLPSSNATRIAFIPPGGVVCLTILSGFDVSMSMSMSMSMRSRMRLPMHSYFIWPQRAAILSRSRARCYPHRQTCPIDIIIDSVAHISNSAYLYYTIWYEWLVYIFASVRFMHSSPIPQSSLLPPCAIHMHAHHIFAYQVCVCRVMLLIDKVLRLQRFRLEFHLRNLPRGRGEFYVFGQFGVNNFAKQRKLWKHAHFLIEHSLLHDGFELEHESRTILSCIISSNSWSGVSKDSHKQKLIKINW